MFDAGMGRDATANSLPADDLCVGVRDSIAVQRIEDARQMVLLAELEVRGTCEAEFGLTTVAWLAQQAGISRASAKARVRVANVLRRKLPVTRERMLDGRVSFEQARVMANALNTRIEDRFCAMEDAVLDAAAGVSLERWKQDVQMIVRLLDEDGGHDPGGDIEVNKLHVRHVPGGVAVAGQFYGEHAAVVARAVELVSDQLYRQLQHDTEVDPTLQMPCPATRQALAFEELCRRGLACDLESSKPPVVEAIMVIRADDPYRQVADLDGVRLPDGTTRTLRCAAELTALIVDSLGVPLAMGDRVRLATLDQKKALAVRDGGCVFSGCDAPARWCDAHHMPDWQRGGRTDLDSMALLCRRHHGIAHRNGWSTGIDHDGWVWFRNPNERVFWGQRHGRTQPNDPDHQGPEPPEM
jgi:hypothetical protein